MNIFEYLRYLNGDEDLDTHSVSTDNEDKVDNLEELIKINKEIKYRKLGKI